ncbi:MAG: hypothetical protein KAQ66_01705 [Rhodospirillaceae bacterium]|nr:hypothetical protein [Rhodospirillaceae bacterium]MCK5545813.1 hypothetical protein [Rhodospirillaceae bacterium]
MTTFTTINGQTIKRSASPLVRISLSFIGIAVFCVLVGDLEISTLDPWQEMGRMALGAVSPDFFTTENLGRAFLNTLAFAIIGVALGSALGFALSMVFHNPGVRFFCAFIRAIHELFWGLIFLQAFGLTPLTGVLALAIPYAGIFAKVYSEILDESDQAHLKAAPEGTGFISFFLFVRIPDVWAHIKTYTLYRLECGLRSSTVLGFIGLPTIGFHLESAFKQGNYEEVAALLYLFFALIASMRWWMRPKLVPFYVATALFVLPVGADISMVNVVRFLTEDIVPGPLRWVESYNVDTFYIFGQWLRVVVVEQALPGIVNTVVLTMIALVGAGGLTLIFFPLVSAKFFGRWPRKAGHMFLVIMRSTPEYIMAYVFLQLWGPSMLPAIVALSLHNGAIIGHLIGHHADQLPARADAPKGLNLYAYDVLPRIYRQFLAFLFYRWEVIMRETAILGILGIHTLGFYVDSAFVDIRFDRALVLIVITALLNISVDKISRTVRTRLRLSRSPDIV